METLENNNFREFWCHQCRFKFTMELSSDFLECTKCKSDMIEQIEENENQLESFKPFQIQQANNINGNSQQQQQQQQQPQMLSNQISTQNNFGGMPFNLFPNLFSSNIQRNNNINLQNNNASLQNNNNNNASLQNNNNNNVNINNRRNPNTLIQITNFNFSRPSLNQLFTSMFPNTPGFGFGFDDNIDNIIHYLMMNDPNIYGTPPASEESIKNLKEIKIQVNANASEPQEIHECCVCKEEFKSEEIAKQMPCTHLFHKDCLLPWLKQHNSCPICRFELPTDNPDYEQRKNNLQQQQQQQQQQQSNNNTRNLQQNNNNLNQQNQNFNNNQNNQNNNNSNSNV